MRATIKLTKTWTFDEDEPLGEEGGFGKVFKGKGEDGKVVAIKRIHAYQQQASQRELDLAKDLLGHNLPHIIPILDAGLDRASQANYIVMALAQQSLQDLIDRSAPLSETDALEILDAIAAGLLEIQLVHRDLKPRNVLLHNGVWKLCDLGLARYVDAVTAPHTMKGYLSWDYAAPEQWKLEHANREADVYALGCIIYALMNGRPPFEGSNEYEYKRMHLYDAPPALAASDRLRSLAADCLAKPPLARPSLTSVRAQLERAREKLGSGSSDALPAVSAALAEEKARTEAQEALRTKTAEERKELIDQAKLTIRGIFNRLVENIQLDAPACQIKECTNENVDMLSYDIRLGKAALRCWIYPRLTDHMIDVTQKAGWEVLCGVLIWIQTQRLEHVWPMQISANLWFGKLDKEQETCRWWEARYTRGEPPEAPFGLIYWDDPKDLRLADPPEFIDGEYFDEFYKRWAELLAAAARP